MRSCALAPVPSASYPILVHRPAGSFHASFRRSVALPPLRFPLVVMTYFQEDFHLLISAHARRTAPRGGHAPAPLHDYVWRLRHSRSYASNRTRVFTPPRVRLRSLGGRVGVSARLHVSRPAATRPSAIGHRPPASDKRARGGVNKQIEFGVEEPRDEAPLSTCLGGRARALPRELCAWHGR